MYLIYLIDDDPLIIEDLRNNFLWMDNGFEVIGSSSCPVTAIGEIEVLKPDVVISDLKMPSMSGIQLIKELRDKDIHCEFVMLSAYGSFEDSREFFLMEGFDYLLKPLQQADAELVLERLSRKLYDKRGKQSDNTLSSSSNQNFNDLIQYITVHFDKRHTLNALSNQFHISPNYICNLFAKHYHSTLTIYLTNLRMREAARLLTLTMVACKEIAITCGYKDYFYFCKVFKEYFGVTPSLYREECTVGKRSCNGI